MLPTNRPIAALRSSSWVLRSLVFLTLAGFLGLGVYRLVAHERTPPADPGNTYRAARAAAVFPVASLASLPPGWRVLASEYEADGDIPVLRIGLRAPSGATIQLVEGAGTAADDLLTTELGADPRRHSRITVSGRTWYRYTGQRGLTAVVLTEPERTIIVAGAAADEDLRGLAGLLN